MLEKYIYAYFLVCCTNQKGLMDMGKSLNGKELGKGISQRKEDGLYIARFTNRFGKRQVISEWSESMVKAILDNFEAPFGVENKENGVEFWFMIEV